MSKKQNIDQGFEVIDTFSDDEITPDKQPSQVQGQKSSDQNKQEMEKQQSNLQQNSSQEKAEIQKSAENNYFDEEENDTEVLHKNISKIYTIKFSQTGKTVAIGTEDGLRIQSTEAGKEKKKYIMEKENNFFQSGIKQVSLMYDTFICAIVTDNKHKQYPDTKVYIWDQINHQMISEYEFYSPIVSIQYMREYLLVASEKRLVLYDIVQKKPLKYILDVYSPQTFQGCQMYDSFTYCYQANNKGIIVATNVWYNNPIQIDINQELGLPTPTEQRIVDISNMVLSPDGSLLAACEKGGNIIKIFETERGQLKCTLYRGKQQKIITDMQFKRDLSAIGLISTSEFKSDDEGTIHIFDISILNSSAKQPIEKLKYIRSLQFNFDILKKQSYSSKESKFQGPLIQFDQKDSNTFTIYSESDYTISQQYNLTSDEPKKRLNDNKKEDGWIDPIQDNN